MSESRRAGYLNSSCILRCVLLVAAAFGGVEAAHAQTVFDQNGFGDHRGTYSVLPYEHVDPLSGNLLLVVTDLALPGNAGLGLQVQRVYNSAVYPDYEAGSLELEEDSWAGIGWRLHFGRVLHEEATDGGATEIEMGDGSRHALYHTTAHPAGWITKEFWVYNKDTHTLSLPNGLVYTFGHAVFLNPRLGVVRYVTEIRDPFNNTLTFSYVGAPGPPDGIAQVRQVLGPGEVREVNFTYDPRFNSLASMTYDDRTWTYGHQAFGPAGYSALVSVQPPAGKPWTYTYESTPGYVGLTTMLVPGGGVVSYTYGDAVRVAAQVQKRTRVVSTRTISGHQITPGTWTFTYGAGDNQDQSIVACPCGTTTYRYLGVGRQQPAGFPAYLAGALAERTVEEGGVVLEREQLTWRISEPVSPDPIPGEGGIWTDPAVYTPLLERRVITIGGQSWTTDLEYRSGLGTFNDYGRAFRLTETGELPTPRRTTREFQYGFTPYLVDRVASESVQVGAEIASSSWAYDLTTGFLREQTLVGIRTRFEPTATGNVDAVIDANDHRTSFLYAWGVVREVRTPLVTTTRTIAPAGLTLDETVGSLTTRYGYDLAFRPTFIRPPGYPTQANEIRYEYDGLHQEWVRLARDQAQTSLQLDGFGRVVGTTNRFDLKTRTTRDACGRAVFASAPYTTGSGDRGVTTQYDALGRVRTVTAADGTSTTQYTYDGIDVTVRDAESRVTRYDSSAFGSPGDARLMIVTDAATQTTRYTYDVLGHLTSVSGPGTTPTRTWVYDERGLLRRDTQPESGPAQYEHDAAGRLWRITDANGQITTLTYDANDRITQRDAAGTDADVTYGYDTHGRLSTTTTAAVSTTYGYDAAGRLASRTDVVNGLTFASTYQYDLNDNLTTLTYPGYPSNRRTVTYAYDLEHRLTTVRQNGADFAHTFSYDDSGRLASYVTGAVTHTVAYDTRDRVQRLTAGPPGAPALDLTYSYNRVSHVLGIADARPGQSQTFTYDGLDRVQTAAGPYGALRWDYDAAGNRVSQIAPGGTTAYAYDATQRLTHTTGVGAETFAYDAIGQLTQDSRGTYTYAGNGVMRTATAPGVAASYTYDGDDLRVLRTINGRTLYTMRAAGGQVLAEYEDQCGTLVWTRDQIHAGGRLLGAVRANLNQPTVEFELAASTVSEGVGSIAPRVRLTTATGAPLACSVSVSFTTQPGTAGSGTDFTATSGTLTFPAGTTGGTLLPLTPAVAIIDDPVDEPNESFTVVLTGGTGVTLGAQTQHAVTIQDNDPPPTISITDVVVNEAAGTATFTVSLSQVSAFPVSVNGDAADGTAREYWDYTDIALVVTFDPLTPSRTVSVPVIDDAIAEPSETFEVQLWNPVNATIADGVGVATILDNERPRAPIDPSLPSQFFALGTHASGYPDYIAIGNRYPVPVPARLTFTRGDGSGVVKEFDVPANARLTVRVQDYPEFGDEDLAIAVQSRDARYPLSADHAVYTSWSGFESGRATEGVTPSPTWYFAEGSIGYFEEVFSLFNPSDRPVDVTATYYGVDGALTSSTHHIEPGPGWTKFWARTYRAPGDHGTKFEARTLAGAPAPIVVERVMTWQAGGPFLDENSAPGVPAPQPAWYFAEGDTGFATYLLVLNPNPTAQTLAVTYFHEDGQTYTTTVAAGAQARVTIAPPPWLPAGSFGMRVATTSGAPIVAERSMYGGPNWTLGHTGIGLAAPAVVWDFTEGSTGTFWTTYVLLANPGTVQADVWIKFTRADGVVIQQYVALPPGTRRSVLVNAVPGMASAEFRAEVFAVGLPAQPFVAERVTYWPGSGGLALSSSGGEEGMASFGGEGPRLASGPPTRPSSPYTGTRLALTPPAFYHAVVTGEPAGPIERALADQFRLEELTPAPPTTNDKTGAGVAASPTSSAVTSDSGWFGAHLTSGRRP